LVSVRWDTCGLREAKVLQGVGAPAGSPAMYSVIALLTFDSAADFERAVARHGEEIIGDIANFTNVQPVIQVNDVLL
jgi:uncharacterized protein (TIGR02118 family)